MKKKKKTLSICDWSHQSFHANDRNLMHCIRLDKKNSQGDKRVPFSISSIDHLAAVASLKE